MLAPERKIGLMILGTYWTMTAATIAPCMSWPKSRSEYIPNLSDTFLEGVSLFSILRLFIVVILCCSVLSH